jgi:hypothetical protein
MARNQHVVPRGQQWAIRGAGNTKDTRRFDTQSEAIAHGRQIARKQGGELVIHGVDGRIREKNTYGSDPHPPKG